MGLSRRKIDEKSRLERSRDLLADEFIRVGDFSEGSKSELIHLVQIYRLVVADVWDPYILGGHFKTGHRGSLQNRPTDITLD